MASGSSGRSNAGSKGYDFGTDDILCSYDDFSNQESSNGSHSDPVIVTNSSKEFNKSRMSRSSVFPTNTYGQQEESLSQEVISTVEKSMKKYADNLMRFLEGISSRLSQLELYCYNLDKSIGEMRSDLVRDHGESDSKLKSLEKHLQEVHRSVQILRDKQELAETQKELAKLQLVQKDSSNEERSTPRVSDSKKTDNPSDSHNQQLALALPHQVAPPTRPMEQPVAAVPSQTPHPQSYYLPTTPAPAPAPAPGPAPHGQYLSSDPQYRTPQQPTQSQVNQTPPTPQQVHPFPQYQQQWAPPQVRPPSSTPVYPSSYPPSQSANPSVPYPPSQSANLPPPPSETLQSSSMPMQVPFTGIPQGASRADVMNYSYGGAGRTAQLPPQHMKSNFGDYTSPPSGAYPGGNNAYMMYDSEGGRTHLPPTPQPQPQPQQAHFSQGGGYPPTSGSLSLQNPQVNTGSNLMVRNQSAPQFVRNHPYNDLVEKLVNMGYRGDHVVSVIQRMEENGQPVDISTVLDRLNGHSSGASQRGGWSA